MTVEMIPSSEDNTTTRREKTEHQSHQDSGELCLKKKDYPRLNAG
jgi:hypothetical protein